jgi:hypothetical protein
MLRLAPVPASIEGVRERLTRDRRWQERRTGKKDHRIFATDRRADKRRSAIRDDGLEWFDAEDLIIEILETDEPVEATKIAPQALAERPAKSTEQPL